MPRLKRPGSKKMDARSLTWADALGERSTMVADLDSHRKRLSKLVRVVPVPAALRPRLWLSSVGAGLSARESEAREAGYSTHVANLPPQPASPVEGRTAVVEAAQRFCCDGEFGECVPSELVVPLWRVLTSISRQHAKVTGGDGTLYSPWHPGVVLGGLRHLSEADAYSVGCALLPAGSPHQPLAADALRPSLPTSRLETWRMFHVLLRLCSKMLSVKKRLALQALLGSCDNGTPLFDTKGLGSAVHPLGCLVTEWTWRLPDASTDYALDCFFVEGTKLVYRLGLGALRLCAKRQVKSPSGSAAAGLLVQELRQLTSAAELVESSYSFRFAQSGVSRYHTRYSSDSSKAMGHSGSFRGVAERTASGPATATALGPARFEDDASDGVASRIPPAALAAIWAAVPARFRHLEQTLLFATSRHGFRLSALYAACGDNSPMVLLVRTVAGDTLGAYLSHPLTTRRSGYFGSGETFVLSCTDRSEIPTLFPWVGVDGPPESRQAELFMYADAQRLAVGGGGSAGGHALELDAELDFGVTGGSKTFANPPLAGVASGSDSIFRVAAVEVWGFRESD
eukprot:m.150695 g.150695  ORF g.150695 m.150695 type:complete len:570 (+) comp23322_c0_seq2:274-1983(+)